ncbi:MAG: hypothetical protein J7L08_00500, partial [Candidatus Aenigmarchaeota archaeon]|nr:hypothetical protein [Candidatus Aenigmarchaeota archaeon]
GTASGIASDMVGAINVGTRLGGEVVTTTGGTSGSTVSEGVKVAASGSDLNYGQDIHDIKSTGFSYSDFPTLLKKATFKESKGENKNDETYTQDIDFTDNVGVVALDTNDNLDNKPVGTYMYFQDGEVIYTYTLEFTNDIDVLADTSTHATTDMKNAQIEILGKSYTISSATADGSHITALELLGGASEQTVNDETPITVTVSGTEYTVTPNIYGSDSVTFTVTYDGTTETTDEMAESDTYELANGVEIGVRDIMYSTKETKTSAVTFYVGAQKLTLDESKEVRINDATIEDYDTTVAFTESDNNKLGKLTITVAPEDDIWLGVGEEWVDPVFGAWKVMFTGLTKTTEDIEATASGDDGKLTVYDIAGNKVEIPFISDTNTHAYPGDEISSGYTLTVDGTPEAEGDSGNMMIANNDMCTGNSAVTNCEGVYFLAVNSGGEARVVEIKDIDTSNNQIDFKDKTTGETWDDKGYTDGSEKEISLGSFMDIKVIVDESAKTVNITNMNAFTGDAANADFKTSLAGEVGIVYDGDKSTVTLYDDTGDTDGALFTFDFIESSDDMTVTTSGATLKEDDDSDIKWGLDAANWGALMVWDSNDKNDLTISYPEEKVIADVYIAPVTATSTTSTGEVTRTGVIKTPVASVDTDVTTAQKTNKNLILVGGPCVNKLTAEALGMDFPTCGSASGIPENGYMIKLVKDAFATGKYAMVIAGWEAENTQAACAKVQADMAELTGTEYTYPSA